MYDGNSDHGGMVVMHKDGKHMKNLDYETMHAHHMDAVDGHSEGTEGGGGIGAEEQSEQEPGAEYKD